jgi:hypothetical protein
VLRDVIPAWLVTVDAPNGLNKDGPATVTFDRSLERITRDASGQAAQADMTFRVDPDPRSHNVLKGHIKDGVVSVEPATLRMILDPYLMPELLMTDTHLRMTTNPDGAARILIGGYQNWMTIYYAMANEGHIKEYAASIDVPAVYYALKRAADHDPDPATGENRQISSAYIMEAVPAFVVPSGADKTARAQ